MSGGSCGCGQATCGCCEGVRTLTPRAIENRPGLAAIEARIGTHGSFRASMEARLSSHVLGAGPARPLAALRVRELDGAIALLDGWAAVADVLTFYQERIVNEGYLRTATEMRSLHGLANLVGYQPGPGVGASVWLSYTLDEKATEEVVIPEGARVQAVPGPGELPQFFETSEDLRARSAWNILGVRKTEPARWVSDARAHELYLAGTQTRLKPGDPLLVARGGDRPEAYRVLLVEEDPEAARTRIELQRWEGAPAAPPPPVPAPILKGVRAVRALHDAPPSGKIAGEIVTMIAEIEEPAPGSVWTDDELDVGRRSLPGLRAAIADKVKAVDHLPQATKLRAWGKRLDESLAGLGEALEAHLNPPRPACSVEALVGRLSATRPVPPRSPLNLPASVGKRFEAAGDAGLTMLAQASPDVARGLADGLSGCRADAGEVPPISVYALRLRASLFGHNAPKQRESGTLTEIGEWPIVSIGAAEGGRFVRHEAPDRLDLEGSYDGILPQSWLLVDMTGVPDHWPDRAKPPLAAVSRSGAALVARVQSAQAKASRADYGVTGEVTRLVIESETGWISIPSDQILAQHGLVRPAIADLDYQVIRGTAVYAASEALALAPSPIIEPVCGGGADGAPIELDGLYLGLEPGRYVMVSGERADIDNVVGVAGAEPAMIVRVEHDVRLDSDEIEPLSHAVRRAEAAPAPAIAHGVATVGVATEGGVYFPDIEQPAKQAGDRIHSFIWLNAPLAYCYRRESIAIHANLVRATHGESQLEVLGNGDAAKANQSFVLKHAPLTWLPSATPTGADPALEIHVDNIRWNRVESFTDLPPTARAYTLRTDDKGVSTILFGDGREGARLPTGSQNVVARYRKGLGKAGNVRAGQISQLVTRPLGVKDVVNPYRASGGAEAESVSQVRANAPLATAALGRLVATRDYADFARTFAGIAKADAIELSDGRRNIVHVTVAGEDDVPIDPGSDLIAALARACRALGDPFQPVVIRPRALIMMVIEARLRVDADRLWEPVATAVREALLAAFAFERRALGQGVAASEVIHVIQQVPGVAMVDLDVFGGLPTAIDKGGVRPLTPSETAAKMKRIADAGAQPKIDARRADPLGGVPAAELVLLSPEVAATLALNRIEDPA